MASPLLVGPQDRPAASCSSPLLEPAVVDYSSIGQLLSTKQSDIKQLLEDLGHIVNSDIELPRIVACGDQSSGKSSVLEAISTLNFPRAENTCTKFATEVSLCHKPGQNATSVSTNIRWHDPTSRAERAPGSTTLEDLAGAIQTAYNDMEKHYSDLSCTYFKDTLQIQASGSSLPDLTLIDLPGIVHSGKTDDDRDTVLDIIRRYICEEKTIILAVVCADRDPETQAILKLAQRYDPNGERTMGIITRPDRVEGSVLRDRWIRIASGNDYSYRFKYGWHVVRNRGPQESALSFQERDHQEIAFFKGSPWQQLDSSRLGIEALREHLKQISEVHLNNALPVIYNQLKQKEDDCVVALNTLGRSRGNLQDQVRYLTDISTKFNCLTKEAIHGEPDCSLFDGDESTFCSLLYERYESFARAMHNNGHTFYINDDQSHAAEQERVYVPSMDPNGISERLPEPEAKTTQEFLDWVQAICAKRRGRELGLPGPLQVTRVFREQSKNWRAIAEMYLESVWEIILDLLIKAAKSSVTNSEAHTADDLVVHLIRPEMAARKQRAAKKLEEILRPYERNSAISTDPEFQKKYEDLLKANNNFQIPELAEHLMSDEAPDSEEFKAGVKQFHNRLSTFQPKRPVYASGPASLLSLMSVYYNGALTTFIDNVILLVIEGTLLFELPEIFNPGRVVKLNDDEEHRWLIEALANEPDEDIERREFLTKKLGRMRDALQAFQRRLGDAAFRMMETKRTCSLPYMPPHRVNFVCGVSPYAEHRTDPRNESRPGSSHSRRSSTNSSTAPTSTSSVSTLLTVPSRDCSPRKDTEKSLSKSQSATMQKASSTICDSDAGQVRSACLQRLQRQDTEEEL